MNLRSVGQTAKLFDVISPDGKLVGRIAALDLATAQELLYDPRLNWCDCTLRHDESPENEEIPCL